MPKARILIDARCGCQMLVNREGFVLLAETCPVCMSEGLVRIAQALGWTGEELELPLFPKPESGSDQTPQS